MSQPNRETIASKQGHRMAERIEAGTRLWINCWMVRELRTPFGGL